MRKNAKIELLNKYEAMMEEIKAEADSIRNSIKAEMEAREVEELIAPPDSFLNFDNVDRCFQICPVFFWCNMLY